MVGTGEGYGAELVAWRVRRHWPEELRSLASYVLWQAVPRAHGGFGKRPVRYSRGEIRFISAFDPRGHLTFSEAVDLLPESGADGLGLVLDPGMNRAVVDLDGVMDDGVLDGLGQEVVGALDGYAEWSPSMRGVHVWVRAAVPTQAPVRRDRVEVLRRGLITVTGDVLPSSGLVVPWRQRELDAVCARYLPERDRPALPSLTGSSAGDDETLRRALSARNGARFHDLFHGAGGGASVSENDFRLALMLLCATRNDVVQARRLMLRSARVRRKWGVRATADGRTYLDLTLERAAQVMRRF